MNEPSSAAFDASAAAPDDSGVSPAELVAILAVRWKLLLVSTLVAAGLAFGYTSTLPPVYTATATIMPPQAASGGAGAALASLGGLGGLGGMSSALAGVRNPAEQYAAFLESTRIADQIVEAFSLQTVYGAKTRTGARKQLAASSSIGATKKGGLVFIDVTDTDPKRAAEIANRYVVELRRLTGTLAVGEAQRRRVFFEKLLTDTRDRLADAQKALQSTGFSAGALRSEPRAAAENFARLQAEMAAAEVRLQAMRGSMTDNTSEVQRQQATVEALRGQLSRTERPGTANAGNGDYVSRFREYRYQETLFELYARQFELARADESRETDVVQVIDIAMPPELKSGPRRLVATALSAGIVATVVAIGVLLHGGLRRRRTAASPA